MAAEWWDPNGKFRPLHLMNPCRLDYITRQIAAEFGRDLTAAVAGVKRKRGTGDVPFYEGIDLR